MTSSTSNRLPILAAEIRAAHDAATTAAQTALDRMRQAGKGLVEAKGLVEHGQWLPWLKDLGIESRMAQRYMRLARMDDVKYDTVSHLTINQALADASDAVPDPLGRYGEALLRENGLKDERTRLEYESIQYGQNILKSILAADDMIVGEIEMKRAEWGRKPLTTKQWERAYKELGLYEFSITDEL
jgi:hypothetical protein